MQLLANSCNQFGVDLFRRFGATRPEENVFFSPLSVSMVLTLARAGARGRTAREMDRVLHFGNLPEDSVHSEMGALFRTLTYTVDDAEAGDIRRRIVDLRRENEELTRKIEKPEFGRGDFDELMLRHLQVVDELKRIVPRVDPYDLNLATGLFGARSCPFRPEFVKRLTESHATTVDGECDFEAGLESERHRINQWVERNTGGRITGLLGPGSLDPLTRLLLVSAVYFRGDWRHPFPEADTRKRMFRSAVGGVRTPMMSTRHEARYAAFNPDGTVFETPRTVVKGEHPVRGGYPPPGGWQVLEKVYRGGKLSMLFVLPGAVDGLPGLERGLDSETLTTWTAALETRTVDVTVPRLRIDATVSLEGPLKAMGMASAFEPPGDVSGADFSAMSESSDPMNQFYIASIAHRALVEVNEQGTEAAAAAAALFLAAACTGERVDFVPEFRADHPFLFLIRHRATGAVLFLGRVYKPST